MALSTAKLTELPPHLFISTFSSFPKHPHIKHFFFKPFSSSSSKLPKTPSTNPHSTSSSSSNTWIKKWPSSPNNTNANPPSPSPPPHKPHSHKTSQTTLKTTLSTPTTTTTAIDRIVLRLRNLGLGSDDDDNEHEVEINNETQHELELGLRDSDLVSDEKLGDLLKRDWVRPDEFLDEDEDEDYDTLLPWERGVDGDGDNVGGDGEGVMKKRVMRAPTLAELTIEDEELRRLRRMGMTLRERVSVAKAGITGAVLEKIHDQWRKCELVRLKFHEELAHDMRTAHEIVEVGEFHGLFSCSYLELLVFM